MIKGNWTGLRTASFCHGGTIAVFRSLRSSSDLVLCWNSTRTEAICIHLSLNQLKKCTNLISHLSKQIALLKLLSSLFIRFCVHSLTKLFAKQWQWNSYCRIIEIVTGISKNLIKFVLWNKWKASVTATPFSLQKFFLLLKISKYCYNRSLYRWYCPVKEGVSCVKHLPVHKRMLLCSHVLSPVLSLQAVIQPSIPFYSFLY